MLNDSFNDHFIPMCKKKMNYKTWKNIQRSAYLFYGLMYIHIMLLYIPKFDKKLFEIILYSIIFFAYYFLRIRKYFKDKSKPCFSK